MLLLFPNGDYFATGAVRYKYCPATEGDTTNRIILPIEIADTRIDAVVDTGAPYAILPPQTARLAGFSPEFVLRKERMLIRGMRLDGSVTRLNIRIIADIGEDLELQATVFVPDVEEFWGDFPAFIGLSGFLERMRFAVDPVTDTFYFRSLELTDIL